MIRLRQTIERGTRHRWLGPLFVFMLCLMLALLFLHGLHDSHHATELGEFCLGLTIMFSLLIVIRLKWRVVVQIGPAASRPGSAGAAAAALAPVRFCCSSCSASTSALTGERPRALAVSLSFSLEALCRSPIRAGRTRSTRFKVRLALPVLALVGVLLALFGAVGALG